MFSQALGHFSFAQHFFCFFLFLFSFSVHYAVRLLWIPTYCTSTNSNVLVLHFCQIVVAIFLLILPLKSKCWSNVARSSFNFNFELTDRRAHTANSIAVDRNATQRNAVCCGQYDATRRAPCGAAKQRDTSGVSDPLEHIEIDELTYSIHFRCSISYFSLLQSFKTNRQSPIRR